MSPETTPDSDGSTGSDRGAASKDVDSTRTVSEIRALFGIEPQTEPQTATFDDLSTDSVEDGELAISGDESEVPQIHAAQASTVTDQGLSEEELARTRDLASEFEAVGGDPVSFLASYAPVFDALVESAIERLDNTNDEGVAADLQREIRRLLADAAIGVTQFGSDSQPLAPRDRTASAGDPPTLGTVLEALPMPAFLIGPDHTVHAYNYGLAELVGIDETEALGKDNRESIAAATYTDGRRHESLADKVVDAPRTAHEEFDIERIDADNEYTRQLVFEDRSVTKNERGEEIHISFQAVPIFGADDELQGVLEVVYDRSEEQRRQATMEELVSEVCSTLDRIGNGDLTARADFTDDRDIIDEELLRIVRQTNAMVTDFEELVTEVREGTTELASSITRAADAAQSINQEIADQHDALESATDEMESFSATMEEVAASADQVTDAADEALDAANTGRSASQDASAATDEVLAMSRELVETVRELDDEVAEIEAVADVIGDIADQTNILALNANIEAARASESGEGFAVVADEVKELASETRSYTEDIAARIEAIQEQTTETVRAVDSAHERIEDADDEIHSALDALDTIAETVADAADGINEVARANNEQAATVEEVTATLDTARESAADVDETADNIVTETNSQEEAVQELIDVVDALVEDQS